MKAVWKLGKGSDRRIRSGHPWLFSNELSHSPKGIEPGTAIELQDYQGQFVAYGYGNPHSLIAFRALSFRQDDLNSVSIEDFILNKVVAAWKYRWLAQKKGSFRLCYSESDFLPGLVIDYYLIETKDKKRAQVFSVQITTAGMQKLVGEEKLFIQKLVAKGYEMNLTDLAWENTFVITHNDVGIRKLEGLEVLPAQTVHEPFSLEKGYSILVESCLEDGLIHFEVDLVDGQKTGFFLDQWKNIQELVKIALPRLKNKKQKVRVLDLCTYVGQWSTQLAAAFKKHNIDAEFTLLDISELALGYAEKNVKNLGFDVIAYKKDVVKDLDFLADHFYDIVIADPPAFIKAKKDIPQGKGAYLKVNTHAFRTVKPDGMVVSCSCSGLLEEKEFFEVISKSIRRNNKIMRVASQARHSVDHPLILQFPEGFYLKMLLHVGT